jgi:hypothetical protein
LARNRCSAPAINGATAGIGESEEPDQVIVDRRRGRLHEKDLLAAYGVEKLHGNLAVGISIHDTGQRWVDRTGENRELIVHARLAPNRIRTTC